MERNVNKAANIENARWWWWQKSVNCPAGGL